MPQAVFDQHTVLAAQGNDIAHGADRGKVGIVLQQPVHIGVFALDRLYQLEGDADA